jgi:hypothetical protein
MSGNRPHLLGSDHSPAQRTQRKRKFESPAALAIWLESRSSGLDPRTQSDLFNACWACVCLETLRMRDRSGFETNDLELVAAQTVSFVSSPMGYEATGLRDS